MSEPKTRIAILSLSRIATDRRVLRQCETLAGLGHPPHVIGYAEADDRLPWDFTHRLPPRPTVGHRLSTLLRQVPAWLGRGSAAGGFWLSSANRWALAALREIAATHVVANDWPALTIATAWKRESGAGILYDTHEFATLEFDERPYWRLVYKPFVSALEAEGIKAADAITTVGPHLAAALHERYLLATEPIVVRNTPERIDLPRASTHWPLRLLYHGNLLPDRGIEQLIDSVPLWREPHTLTIRGAVRADYLASLRGRAQGLGVADRIRFVDAVPPDDVVRVAAETADVGVHFTPIDTVQRQFSLPNKFFEYVAAGLAVVVSPARDLAALVEKYGIGLVSTNSSVAAIAEAVSRLDQSSVEGFRERARLAAAELNWDRERQHFIDAISLLLGRPLKSE